MPRYCTASSSRLTQRVTIRRLSFLPQRHPENLPFFSPPFRSPVLRPQVAEFVGKGKGKDPSGPKGEEEEVSDAEWEIRVGEYPDPYVC
jgi:hypothetical protein